MTVGTIGVGVPDEVLAAAGVEITRVVGEPGASTELADRFVEPMVGKRARSQLQRLLDGTYDGLELLLISRETEAQLRLFYTLREIRRLHPELRVPPVHLVDFQHVRSPATHRWNIECVRKLCALLDVDVQTLRTAISACNARRAPGDSGDGYKRIYVIGSDHDDMALCDVIEAAGATVVTGPPILTNADGDPIDAIARRYVHPLLARARGSSTERAALTVDAAKAVRADVVIAFYLEGDDGLRWEYPEHRAELAAAGIPVILLEHQLYDVRGLELHV